MGHTPCRHAHTGTFKNQRAERGGGREGECESGAWRLHLKRCNTGDVNFPYKEKVDVNLLVQLLEVFGVNIDIQRGVLRVCTADILVQEYWEWYAAGKGGPIHVACVTSVALLSNHLSPWCRCPC